MGEIEGYCVRCKTKRTMVEPEQVRVPMRNRGTDRLAWKGTCPVSGTTMFRLIGPAPELV